MLTFDFQKRTSKILRRLRILGTLYSDKNNTFCFNLYLIYTIVVNIYYNLHNIAQAANIFYHYDDLDELTSSGLLTIMETLTNVKAYYVVTNKSRILKINNMVQKWSFQPKNSRQEEMAKYTFKIFDVMSLLHTLGPTLTVVFFGCYPIAEMKTNKKLPFSAWYPYDYKISPLFEITYFHQLSSSLIMAHIHINSDCLAYNLIAIIIVQLDFLADNLKNVNNNIKSNLGNFEKERNIAFLDCVKHHKDILSCFNEVYKILNINLLGQFVVSTTSLCLTSLQLSTVNPTSTHFMALMVYELAVLVQLLMFCWWGNELIFKSQQIPQAAFESDWIEASIPFKKSIMFFIQQTQKPLTLYAVDFFTISLTSFAL
ncbi:uncharacterized protein BDFB_003391, partial [Asbolus verrucosus]